MNSAERIHRLTLEFLFFIFLYFSAIIYQVDYRVLNIIIYAHTCSFLFNGHLFAMCAHDLFWFALYKDKKKFYYYLNEMRSRMYRKQPAYVAGVVFFGSLARGVFRETSDLDVRFIAQKGFWNAFKTSHFVFVERFYALLAGFPIDAYMFRTEKEIREKMDVENEHPVCMYYYGSRLKEILPEIQTYQDFETVFFPSEEVGGE